MKVGKLSSAQAVQVKTDSTSMGVRGTDFVVTAPPSGEVLVTCDDGEVVCTDDQGHELRAIPGTVVEERQAEEFRTVRWRPRTSRGSARAGPPNDSRTWNRTRLHASRPTPLSTTGSCGSSPTRTPTWRTTRRWWPSGRTRTAPAQIGQRLEIARERRLVGASLARLRRVQFPMERVTFRLTRLERIAARGFGAGTLSSGITTAQFFQRFDSERRASSAHSRKRDT